MCGLAGVAFREAGRVDAGMLSRMAHAIRHRGPDGSGIYAGGRHIGLAHVRLSIVDIAGGAQPLTNENGRIVVVYNGEIYNHGELRAELTAHGHRFRTHCDTEVIVHAYEQWGEAMLDRFNGQFALALYDRENESLFLARDRFGVRPLFYSLRDGDLYFGSEVKALFASGEVEAAPDYEGLDEVFTFWAARPPRTPFRNVLALEPGCCAVWRAGSLRVRRYYELAFGETRHEPADALAQLDHLMRSSVHVRMQADVPVGAYLSGGLDSTVTSTLAARETAHTLRTFSVTFDDPEHDESHYQTPVVKQIGSRHAVQRIGADDIVRIFPGVIRHTETPLVRTAPAPLFLLSKLARENNIKVVLTGEGADEVFLGYDLFKETIIRRFCLRQPASAVRPKLLDRLYPYLAPGARGGEMWRRFFLEAGAPDDPLFSHMPRFLVTTRIKDFYSSAMRSELSSFDAMAQLRASLPPAFAGWSALNRADYLEFTTLLSPYLLASQGDRMGMAHGVEGRFPFLDHRLVEFAAALPARSKLSGLHEKAILKRWAKDFVWHEAVSRGKQPYRAPDVPAFFGANESDYVTELLEPRALQQTGIFDGASAAGLVRRCRAGLATSFRESQALVAILSTQLWHREFFEQKPVRVPDTREPSLVSVPAQ